MQCSFGCTCPWELLHALGRVGIYIHEQQSSELEQSRDVLGGCGVPGHSRCLLPSPLTLPEGSAEVWKWDVPLQHPQLPLHGAPRAFPNLC